MITDFKTFNLRVSKMPEENIKKIQLDIIQEHERTGWDFCGLIWTGLYDLSFQFVKREVTEFISRSVYFDDNTPNEKCISEAKDIINSMKKCGGWIYTHSDSYRNKKELLFVR